MGAVEAATAQVEKKCYKNQTAGWLGVVKLDHLGAQIGHSIEPYGTVYLSDEEAILTARAPKDPKDNPFVEQNFMFEDANGQRVEQGMRPLVLIEDDREIPKEDRYVPGHPDSPEPPPAHDVNLNSLAAGQRDADAVLERDDDREVPTQASAPTLVPSSSAAVPPSHAKATPVTDGSVPAEPEEDVRESWVDVPDRTEEPQQGNLGGSNEQVGAVEGDAAKSGSATGAPPQQPVQQQVASSSVEEHAAHTASGEETGAADTPTGKAPEGEFASHEEVGSPEAPNQGAS